MSTDNPEFEEALVEAIPHLRAFARSFTAEVSRADDLVQETLVKAWYSRDSFAPGTNFRAWLFTILRNVFISQNRKQKREVSDPDNVHTSALAVPPEQYGHLELQEFNAALEQIPPDQREALLLIGAEGFSYEEAAEICGCAVGTIKSCVNRARSKLGGILGYELDSADTPSGCTQGGDTASHGKVRA